MKERKFITPCGSHDEMTKMMGRIEEYMRHNGDTNKVLFKKLATLEENQGSMADTLADVQRVVNNGLKGEMSNVKISLDSLSIKVCSVATKVEEKFIEYDKFDWFRKPMNTIRNSMFWGVIKVAAMIVIVLAILHVTDNSFIATIKSWVK